MMIERTFCGAAFTPAPCVKAEKGLAAAPPPGRREIDARFVSISPSLFQRGNVHPCPCAPCYTRDETTVTTTPALLLCIQLERTVSNHRLVHSCRIHWAKFGTSTFHTTLPRFHPWAVSCVLTYTQILKQLVLHGRALVLIEVVLHAKVSAVVLLVQFKWWYYQASLTS